ncbi:PLP-dependent aminotransferase family protein, partial [Streptomyces sp. SID2119]|nr:PLP-dependent aminotransferase family protein [Streptomyces sp. SID2119]
ERADGDRTEGAPADGARDGLVVGYATPAEHAYPEALEALCRALPPPG